MRAQVVVHLSTEARAHREFYIFILSTHTHLYTYVYIRLYILRIIYEKPHSPNRTYI